MIFIDNKAPVKWVEKRIPSETPMPYKILAFTIFLLFWKKPLRKKINPLNPTDINASGLIILYATNKIFEHIKIDKILAARESENLLSLQYKKRNKNDIKPQKNEKSLPASKETPNIEYNKLKKKG